MWGVATMGRDDRRERLGLVGIEACPTTNGTGWFGSLFVPVCSPSLSKPVGTLFGVGRVTLWCLERVGHYRMIPLIAALTIRSTRFH